MPTEVTNAPLALSSPVYSALRSVRTGLLSLVLCVSVSLLVLVGVRMKRRVTNQSITELSLPIHEFGAQNRACFPKIKKECRSTRILSLSLSLSTDFWCGFGPVAKFYSEKKRMYVCACCHHHLFMPSGRMVWLARLPADFAWPKFGGPACPIAAFTRVRKQNEKNTLFLSYVRMCAHILRSLPSSSKVEVSYPIPSMYMHVCIPYTDTYVDIYSYAHNLMDFKRCSYSLSGRGSSPGVPQERKKAKPIIHHNHPMYVNHK